MQIAFPFRLDERGLIAAADDDAHVRDLIEQVLFTAPGERVNRPDFGCGLRAMVFAAASPEILTATQAMVQAALQRWLSDLIQVEAVSVEVDESQLIVNVQYVRITDRAHYTARFAR